MKFGEELLLKRDKEWAAYYLDYAQLKAMIRSLEECIVNAGSKGSSLSVPMSPDTHTATSVDTPNASNLTHEQFFVTLEQEMKKIELFTKTKVTEIRQRLSTAETFAEKELSSTTKLSKNRKRVLFESVGDIANEFLRLETYVNLNYTGFHKILKKHDRRLPNPCKAFYTNRLQQQSWVRGDYSDILVTMSRVFSAIRGDKEGVAKEDERQNFVRSTTKYWVHTEDISAIKYAVLQHLPVFLQDTMTSGSDSQLVNSVYLDNRVLELYQGRLDKTPGAIALRMRWYGSGVPETVFVERKTHRESWAGEVSVKERFIVPETAVKSVIDGSFNLQAEIEKLKKKGKKEEVIEEWYQLSYEILQAIQSKHLQPTMRTQYMRTAFQIPFDATVRVSLDTNLCMINELTKETSTNQRWFRDPNEPVPNTEITRFPHAVLEVKLQLEEGQPTPSWVSDMIHSGTVVQHVLVWSEPLKYLCGKLMQVHKFSKFIHGCAVLLPEDVRAMPYWIDDVTLVHSITSSGSAHILENPNDTPYFNHLLPHDERGCVKLRTDAVLTTLPTSKSQATGGVVADDAGGGGDMGEASASETSRLLPLLSLSRDTSHVLSQAGDYEYEDAENGEFEYSSFTWANALICCVHLTEDKYDFQGKRMVPQKLEPKLLFANERTFMKWLHMAVLLSSTSMAILSLAPSRQVDGQMQMVQYLALFLLPVSLFFIVYGMWTYLWRSEIIKRRMVPRWDDPVGPVIAAVTIIIMMSIQFFLKMSATPVAM